MRDSKRDRVRKIVRESQLQGENERVSDREKVNERELLQSVREKCQRERERA